MKKKHRNSNSELMKKAIPLIPENSLLTEAGQIPDSRDPKTNAAIPSDENVVNAKNYVAENQK